MRFFFFLIFLFSSLYLQAQSAAEAYVNKFDSLAIEVLNKYEIPASLVLGIALHESGAGTSKLSKVNNNHFGVKGRVKSSKTKSGYASVYRKFDTDEAAYLYFGEMLSRRKYYMVLKGDMNYMKWLKAMKAANYATSSKWVGQVDQMIKRYKLTRFDTQVPAPMVPHPAAPIFITVEE